MFILFLFVFFLISFCFFVSDLFIQKGKIMTTNDVITFSSPYWEVLLPAIFALADVITGLLQAQINGTKNSSVMRKGLYRKAGEILIVGLAWVFCLATAFPVDLAGYIAAYIVLMEALSVSENLKLAGVPVPDWVTKKAREQAEKYDHMADTEDKAEDKADKAE